MEAGMYHASRRSGNDKEKKKNFCKVRQKSENFTSSQRKFKLSLKEVREK